MNNVEIIVRGLAIVCENFEFDETENDWIKLVPKIKLFFLILEM